MRPQPNILAWQMTWGTPRGFFVPDRAKFHVMMILAIFVHAIPFSILWKVNLGKKVEHMIELQNVDLLEPETEEPPPPPVEVQKPRNAFEFLKMAIPIFRKPAAPAIREVAQPIKINEPKIAEPRLVERKLPAASLAPAIKLEKSAAAPKMAEIAKISLSQRNTLLTKEPALKLEEVGRRAVSIPQTPAIRLDRSSSRERVADIARLPRASLAPRSSQSGDRLVERSAPVSSSRPSSLPTGYQPRGGLSLDGPRDVVRAPHKPVLESAVPKPKTEEKSAVLTISKEKVKITGPLSSRKVLKSYVPEYPAWARAQNLEADVAIRFTVSPSGDVLGNAVIERTSGYPDLDRLCLQTLKQWKFSPLAHGDQDQWGVITFRFRLD